MTNVNNEKADCEYWISITIGIVGNKNNITNNKNYKLVITVVIK